MPDRLLKGAVLVTPDRVLANAAVGVSGGRIDYVGKAAGALAPRGREVTDLGGGWLLPGFIDTHCHGGGGRDSVLGRYDAKMARFAGPSEDDPAVIARAHARFGTTAVVIATTAAPMDELKAALGRIASAAETRPGGARVLGSHVEGTFLKDPAYAGAQAPQNFREPSVGLFEELQKSARGTIRVVNVAPEYGAAAVELIRHVSARYPACAVGAGHTGCDRAQALAAIDAGLRLAIHFSNGPISMSYKPPGMFTETVLADGRVTAELIMDGHHVNPAYVMSFIAAKRRNCVGITDAMFLVGERPAGSFEMFGKRGEVDPSGEVIRLAGSGTLLFGSCLTMDRALRNLVGWIEENRPGVYHPDGILPARPSRSEALALAAPLFTSAPAEVLRVSGEMGSLAEGKLADMVHLGEDLAVRRVYVGGEAVYEA